MDSNSDQSVQQNVVPVKHTGRNSGQMPPRPPKKSVKKLIVWLVTSIVVVIGLIIAVGFGLHKVLGNPIESDKYQAVFLTNGQVYFGKLQHYSDYYKLTDVYYLQASQADNKTNNPQQSSDTGNSVQLVKLGNEVHGPEDAMYIDRSQVLFFENLKNNGKVTDSITKFQSSKQQ